MRLTIIPVDKMVNVDNQFFTGLDIAACNVPANVHALQWYGTEGEIEFVDNADRTKPQNEAISELPAWATACFEVWSVAKAEEDARIAAELEAAAAAAEALEPIPATTV